MELVSNRVSDCHVVSISVELKTLLESRLPVGVQDTHMYHGTETEV